MKLTLYLLIGSFISFIAFLVLYVQLPEYSAAAWTLMKSSTILCARPTLSQRQKWSSA